MKNSKNRAAFIFFALSIFVLLATTIHNISLVKKNNDKRGDSKEFAMDDIKIKLYRSNPLFFEKPHFRNERVLAFTRPGDCPTCYEEIIRRLSL